MGMFADLMSKVFGHAAAATPEAAPGAAPTSATAPTIKAVSAVDVAVILDEMVAKSSEKGLDWRKSIVDLLKLVGMDSGLAARKELAKDLGYTGDTQDSAAMNIWLIKEVLKKFGENGGKLPAELGH